MTTVTATELQNNFGKFLQMAEAEDIIIMRNGKEVARLISNNKSVSFLSDALVGVLKNDYSLANASAERMKKYEDFN